MAGSVVQSVSVLIITAAQQAVCTRLANAAIFDDTLAVKSILIEARFIQPQAGETGR
jgi:hypothetical protein